MSNSYPTITLFKKLLLIMKQLEKLIQTILCMFYALVVANADYVPSGEPSGVPSNSPTSVPSLQPTVSPTGENDTFAPTSTPSSTPTLYEALYVYVDSLSDNDAVGNGFNCDPPSGNCTLRSAWTLCQSYSQSLYSICIIELPPDSFININSNYDSLIIEDTDNIRINGNNATITGGAKKPTHWDELGGDFPMYTGLLSDTNNAQTNYAVGCTTGCLGDQLQFSGCSGGTSEDTYYRLFNNRTGGQVSSNDDSCGLVSQIIYTVPDDECEVFCVHVGCYGSGTCESTVTAFRLESEGGPPEDVAGFPFVTTELSNTNYATQNYDSACFSGCQGEIWTLTMCNDASEFMDTYLRLLDSTGTQVASNDDTCNFQSEIVYTIETTGCSQYCLHIGCYGSDSCSGAVDAYVEAAVSEQRFITYNNATKEEVYYTPSIALHDMTLRLFGGSEVDGGVLCFNGSIGVTLQNVSVYDSTGANGGFMFASNGQATSFMSVTNVHIENCVANSGGAIYIGRNMSNIRMENASIVYSASLLEDEYGGGGEALYGGGALFIGWFNDDVTLHHVTITECTASTNGGGILLNSDNTNIAFNDIMVTACSATYYGGGIFSRSNDGVVVENSYFEDVKSGQQGGCVFSGYHSERFQINNCYFGLCYAANGGSVYVGLGSTEFSMSNVLVNQSSATNGGGIMLSGLVSNSTLSNVHIQDGLSSSMYGGGIYVGSNNVNFHISNSSIDNCAANTGGGIYVLSGNNYFTLSDSNITNCKADAIGGGLYIDEENENVQILGCLFENDISMNYGGGLASNTNNPSMTLAGSQFINNTAIVNGGGVHIVTEHPSFVVIDKDGFDGAEVIESDHPYTAGAHTDSDYTLISSKIIEGSEDTIGYIINFNALTKVKSVDVVVISSLEEIENNFYYFYYGGGNSYKSTVEFMSGSGWPGSTLPSLRIPGNIFQVDFYGYTKAAIPTTAEERFYGFKLFAYPIIEKAYQKAMFKDNVAGGKGGAIFLYYNNLFPVFLNSVFDSNSADEGGGMYFRNINTGAALHFVDFVNNTADVEGGAIVFSSTHFGSTIYNSNFTNNRATNGRGGATSISTDNGNGVLANNNMILFYSCNFMGNEAMDGGALYISDGNVVDLVQCTVDSNTATTGRGGAIALNYLNVLTLDSCAVHNNEAATSGGGLDAAESNIIRMTDIMMFNNTCHTVGGAVCIKKDSVINFDSHFTDTPSTGGYYYYYGTGSTDDSQLHVCEYNCIVGNSARFAGGGIASIESPLWTVTDNAVLHFHGNVASRGSAMFFTATMDVNNISLRNMVITENVALFGGTVYWLKDDVMSAEPQGIDSDTIEWLNNSAYYGPKVATQAVQLIGPTQYNVTVYSQSLTPPLVYSLLDYYGNVLPLNGTTSVRVSIVDGSGCRINPYLAGENIAGIGVVMSNGVANFNALEAFCSPGGNLTISFEAQLGNVIGINSLVAGKYYISNTTQLLFRNCVAGEYESNGVCLVCPEGTYSLIAGDECSSCFSEEGIERCYGNQIILSPGYWRRYEFNTAVLRCPKDIASCTGGNVSGLDGCGVGYTGELCAVCDTNYFSEESKCSQCTATQMMTPTLIIYLCGFGLLLIFGIFSILQYYKLVKLEETEEDIEAKRRNSVLKQIRLTSVEGIREKSEKRRSSLMLMKKNEFRNSNVLSMLEEEGVELSPMHRTLAAQRKKSVRNSVSNVDNELSEGTSSTKRGSGVVPIKNMFSPAADAAANEEKGAESMKTEKISKYREMKKWITKNFGRLMGKLKIIVATYQVVTETANVIDVEMPKSWQDFVDGAKFVNLSIASAFPLACSSNFNFISKLYMVTLGPIALTFAIIIIFVYKYYHAAKKINSNTRRRRGDKKRKFAELRSEYLSYFFYLTYLVLPSVTTTIFEIFICTNVDPYNEDPSENDTYLSADMTISCTSAYYYRGVAYACVMILLYPIGVPSLYLYLLYCSKDEISGRNVDCNPDEQALKEKREARMEKRKSQASRHRSTLAMEEEDFDFVANPVLKSVRGEALVVDEVEFMNKMQDERRDQERLPLKPGELSPAVMRLSFLWQAYQPKYWYWEVIETTRRLMLTAVLSVAEPGTTGQNVLSILLSLAYIKIYGYFGPYGSGTDNTLAETGQFQIYFTFFGGMIVQRSLLGSSWNSFVGYVLVMINLSVFVYVFHVELENYRADRLAEQLEEEEEAAARARGRSGSGLGTDDLKSSCSNETDEGGDSDDEIWLDEDDEMLVDETVPDTRHPFRSTLVETEDSDDEGQGGLRSGLVVEDVALSKDTEEVEMVGVLVQQESEDAEEDFTLKVHDGVEDLEGIEVGIVPKSKAVILASNSTPDAEAADEAEETFEAPASNSTPDAEAADEAEETFEADMKPMGSNVKASKRRSFGSDSDGGCAVEVEQGQIEPSPNVRVEKDNSEVRPSHVASVPRRDGGVDSDDEMEEEA